MNKSELLNLKRRLMALALAGTCTLGLTSCGISDSNDEDSNVSKEVETLEVTDENERKEQFLAIYQDKAIIIEPYNYLFNVKGANYQVYLDDDKYNDMYLPMSEFILFTSDSPITAEDYVKKACGLDFPTQYIRSEEYTQKR